MLHKSYSNYNISAEGWMKSEDRLFEVADRQQGYFTSQQAEECGISRSNFHFRLGSGEWVKNLEESTV